MPDSQTSAKEERYGQIRLDGLLYPIVGNVVPFEDLNRFSGKVVTGDYQRDSDDLQSSFILGDLSGGGQLLHKYNPGSDQGRYWWASGVETRDPFSITLSRLVQASVQSSLSYPCGDLAGVYYMSFNKGIKAWNEGSDTFGATIATLGHDQVNVGIEFGLTEGSTPVLWIPKGTNGYETFNGSTLTPRTDIKPVAFTEWDNAIWAITTDGLLCRWNQSAGSWDTTKANPRLDQRHTPKNLLVYYTPNGDDAMFVATNRGLFAYDASTLVFYQSNLVLPRHPDNGLGSCIWQKGGDLYYAAGTGVYRYAVGATISAIGLDRDEGLPASSPADYRGKIVDIAPAHNEIYALVQGKTTGAAVMHWTGIGWHTTWTSTASGTSTRIFVSEAGGVYRVWWGHGDTAYTVELPTDFHNPRQGLLAGADTFGSTGYVESAWFDAGMKGYRKTASYVIITIDELASGCTVTLDYQIDNASSWTTLGSALTQKGQRLLSFGMAGVSFDEIRFRLTLTRTTSTTTPVIDNMALYFVKNPHSGKAWTFDVWLGFDEYHGRTVKQVNEELDDLSTKDGFVSFTHHGIDYRVKVTNQFGDTHTDKDHRGTRRMTVVHVKEPADRPL